MSARLTRLLLITAPCALAACNVAPKQSDNEVMLPAAGTAAADNAAMAAASPTQSPAPAPAAPTTSSVAPAPSPTPTASSPDVPANVHVVRFPVGATAVTLTGSVEGDNDQRYTIDARQGQHMRITLRSPSSSAYMNVYAPGSGPGGAALFRGATDGPRFDANLTSSGVYTVQVYLYRAAARRDATADYNLAIAIDNPGSSSAPPPSSDAGASASPSDVVQHYYGAIDAGKLHQAYALWADNAPHQQNYAQFAQGFAHTRRSSVRITGAVSVEGAAGSSFATVPVAVDAVTDDGRRQHFTGQYVLRRVNDVPGSSAAQRQWHLYSAKLTPR
jgi:hypothetical protein